MQASPLSASPSSRRLLTALTLAVWLPLGAGCDDQSAAALPIWSPTDHDNQASPAPGQTDTQAPRPRMPDLAQHGIDDVVLATWKQNCTTCHGLIGRGDGPQSAMFRPPDLTSSTFQERAIDSEIVNTIAKGRGRMPAFGHLPEDTIMGLMKLVRMLGAPKPGAAATPAADGTPSAGTSLPAGHPPTGQVPAGHPASGQPPARQLPAGHPPTGQVPAGHPAPSGAAPALPPGHP